MTTLLDMTYWRLRRRLRRCAYCGRRSNDANGKVNFGVAFDEKPKPLYHEKCMRDARNVSTPNFKKREQPHA